MTRGGRSVERRKIRGEVGAQGAANENQGQLERVKVEGDLTQAGR